MKNNRDAIRVLSGISIILICMLIMLRVNCTSNNFVETILINLVTGCFVSIVVAYIDYKNKLDELLYYFCSEMQTYYFYLLQIEGCIKRHKDSKECMEAIRGYLKTIGDNALKKRNTIDISWIFVTSNKISLEKDIKGLYEITFGIELAFLDIKLKMNKKVNIKELRKTIKEIEKEVDKEKKVIDYSMKKINNKMINKYWNEYLNEYVKNKN